VAGSLGDLLRAQIEYPDRAQELLLATGLGRVQPFRGRDSFRCSSASASTSACQAASRAASRCAFSSSLWAS
jgi:hypothetical protein